MPRSRRRCLRAWCRAASTATGRTRHGEWHLLLEDLTDTHEIATQWPLPPDETPCRRMVQTLARFHAAWWDDPRLGVEIGTRLDAEAARQAMQRHAGAFERFADHLGDRLSRRAAPALRALLRRRARPAGARPDLPQRHPGAWRCPCLELLRAEGRLGRPALFDWDTWRIGAGLGRPRLHDGDALVSRAPPALRAAVARPLSRGPARPRRVRATTAPHSPRIIAARC